VDTLERVEIIRDLRLGVFDVVVGINLLREGLDLPEVSFIAILDADKEGFLRGYRSLIQTSGRAARNVNGHVVMYADSVSDAMRDTLAETTRRRAVQAAYNSEHGISPTTIVKAIREQEMSRVAQGEAAMEFQESKGLPPDELLRVTLELEKAMKRAASNLEFERAATLRDRLVALRRDSDQPARRESPRRPTRSRRGP
jgi:excinuclease ABC subunit B